MWLTTDVTKDQAAELARRIRVDASSPGVCPMCLALVAYEVDHGDARSIAGCITSAAPLLWDEGLGEVVVEAVRELHSDALAEEALADLAQRGARSAIFRETVRRLATELAQAPRRAYAASLN